MTEKERMLAGEPYRAGDPQLVAERHRCRTLLRRFQEADDDAVRAATLQALLGHAGEGAAIVPPFACDYGYNISLGRNAFVNANAVFLDCAPIEIGDHAQIGPGVQLLAADHPLEPARRLEGVESARPVAIGANAWLGGGAIVLPGRSVGANSVVGAGSVVTRDIPPDTVAAGNPARLIRRL